MERHSIVMYSTDCPKCRVLEAKLNAKGIEYTVCNDVAEMERMGFSTVPVLSVDGHNYEFSEAVKYINEL